MLQHSHAGGKAGQQQGEKETRVTAPGAGDLDPRVMDCCQSCCKRLGFQRIGWSLSPPGSYCRDPLLPPGAGTRRELVLLVYLENSSALGHTQFLCNSQIYIQNSKGQNGTDTVRIRT